jgi:hypothetical protein
MESEVKNVFPLNSDDYQDRLANHIIKRGYTIYG